LFQRFRVVSKFWHVEKQSGSHMWNKTEIKHCRRCSCKLTVILLQFYQNVTTLRSSICYRNPVCLSSVTSVQPTQPVKIFSYVFTPFSTLAICWPPKFYGDSLKETLPSSVIARGVANTSIAMLDLSKAIYRKRCN